MPFQIWLKWEEIVCEIRQATDCKRFQVRPAGERRPGMSLTGLPGSLMFWLAGILIFANPASLHAQNTIVLRDLTLIENVRIESINIDGLVLAGGLRYSWADILQGNVGDQQVEFDSALTNIGLPLFRIRSRMENGNFAELQPMTASLVSQIGTSQGRTAYITWAAAFHDQLTRGNREAAVVPLLKLLSIRDKAGDLSELETRLGLQFGEDGICLNLLPIWFDDDAAADALLNFQDGPWDAASKVYLRSLQNEVPSWGNSMRFHDENSAWLPVLSAQSSLFTGNYQEVIETLGNSELKLNPSQRAIALYYLGQALRAARPENPDAVDNRWKLTLLQIPAEFQSRFPELSAAAIFQVIDGCKASTDELDSLRGELTGRFSNTFHGRRYQSTRN